MTNPLLRPSPYASDGGEHIGRDPRQMTEAEYTENWQPLWAIPGKAIRAKCVDCCAGDESEVRKCVATGCPLWPLRMGTGPKAFRSAAKAIKGEADQ